MNDLSFEQTRSLLIDELTDDQILNSSYEIENALIVIQSLESKIDWLKELKKKRGSEIDMQIADHSNRMEMLRQIILRTMVKLEPDRKTLPFPGIGKVSRREVKGSWSIVDEDAFKQFLVNEGLKDDYVNVKETIKVREAKKLIQELAETKNVPGTEKGSDGETVSISFDDKTDKTVEPNKTSSKKSDSGKRMTLADLEDMESLAL